jgi:hypothetical protein
VQVWRSRSDIEFDNLQPVSPRGSVQSELPIVMPVKPHTRFRRIVRAAQLGQRAFTGYASVDGGRELVILATMSDVSSLAATKAHLSELVARVGEQHERITVTLLLYEAEVSGTGSLRRTW